MKKSFGTVVGLMSVALLCCLYVGLAQAGTVELLDGKQREGQVIVRDKVVTINSKDGKTFQFYLDRVKVISTSEPKKFLVDSDLALNTEAKDGAESQVRLSKGTEVEELERQGDWVKVKAVKETENGWVKSANLVQKVEFKKEEAAAATIASSTAPPALPAAPQTTQATTESNAATEQPKDASPAK